MSFDTNQWRAYRDVYTCLYRSGLFSDQEAHNVALMAVKERIII